MTSYQIGYRFQRRVRKVLEENGWNCITQPKSAFPDIIAWKWRDVSTEPKHLFESLYLVYLIECKVNKYLSKEEKAKAKDLLKKRICSKFLVAYRKKRKIKIYEMTLKDKTEEIEINDLREV